MPADALGPNGVKVIGSHSDDSKSHMFHVMSLSLSLNMNQLC